MLTGIILCAQPTDKKIWCQLPVLLHGLLPTSDVRLCSLQESAVLPLAQAMLIVRDVPSVPLKWLASREMIAVVDGSGDSQVLKMVGEAGLPTITCGLSSCDTITLSSRCADSAVVTLQRTICRFDRTPVEPQEFPIRMTQPLDSFVLMALTAICCFVGTEDALCRTVLTLPRP